MLAHPLDAASQRVFRATEHFANLGKLIVAFKREQAKATIAHFQAEGWKDISGEAPKVHVSAPMGIPILIGEICYHLRTALEYLVFELAKFDFGSPQEFTQFPIVDSPDKFKGWKKQARCKGIKAGHIAAFERLQPYKGCDWSRALRDLSNKDKHREFPSLGGSGALKIWEAGTQPFSMRNPAVFRAKHPVTGHEMYVHLRFEGQISFDDGTPVIETLQKIIAGVAQTIEEFKPEFERS